MSLLEALKDTPPPKRKVDAILDAVTSDERVALKEALGDSTWTHERLAEVLSEQGHPVSESSIRRYRRDVLRFGL